MRIFEGAQRGDKYRTREGKTVYFIREEVEDVYIVSEDNDDELSGYYVIEDGTYFELFPPTNRRKEYYEEIKKYDVIEKIN